MHTVKDEEERHGQDAELIDVDLVDDDDDGDEDIGEQTIVMSEDDDFSDADISMEVNVEKLVAQFEKADDADVHRRAEIRRRLEELVDDGDLEDTYALEFDD